MNKKERAENFARSLFETKDKEVTLNLDKHLDTKTLLKRELAKLRRIRLAYYYRSK